MATSFDNPKELKFVITLGKGTFGGSTNNQITLQGYRSTAEVDKAGGQMMSQLTAQIYGVKQEDMNSVVTLMWKPGDQISNTVQVYAIDGTQQTMVFYGYIVNAWGDYKQMPDVFLMIQATEMYLGKIQPIAPRSYKGQIDVASVMSQIVADLPPLPGQKPYQFENNGVTAQLPSAYLAGTGLDQLRTLSDAAGVDLVIDGTTVAICPKNTPRNTLLIPAISPQSGLMGYPTFDGVGVNFETFFNPAILFHGSFQLSTSIPQAAGQWIAISVLHHLSAEKPGGPWYSTIRGNKSGLAIVG